MRTFNRDSDIISMQPMISIRVLKPKLVLCSSFDFFFSVNAERVCQKYMKNSSEYLIQPRFQLAGLGSFKVGLSGLSELQMTQPN